MIIYLIINIYSPVECPFQGKPNLECVHKHIGHLYTGTSSKDENDLALKNMHSNMHVIIADSRLKLLLSKLPLIIVPGGGGQGNLLIGGLIPVTTSDTYLDSLVRRIPQGLQELFVW